MSPNSKMKVVPDDKLLNCMCIYRNCPCNDGCPKCNNKGIVIYKMHCHKHKGEYETI